MELRFCGVGAEISGAGFWSALGAVLIHTRYTSQYRTHQRTFCPFPIKYENYLKKVIKITVDDLACVRGESLRESVSESIFSFVEFGMDIRLLSSIVVSLSSQSIRLSRDSVVGSANESLLFYKSFQNLP